MTRWEEQLDHIDAAVFSSDMLHDPERKKIFKYFLARWIREVFEVEATEPEVEDTPGNED